MLGHKETGRPLFMNKLLAAIFAVLAIAPHAAIAATSGYMSSDDLSAMCEKDKGGVAGYAMGIADAHLFNEQYGTQYHPGFCLRAGTTPDQLATTICDRFRNETPARSYPGALWVWGSLAIAYPC